MCSTLGAQNRKRIVENHDVRRMCDAFVEIIERTNAQNSSLRTCSRYHFCRHDLLRLVPVAGRGSLLHQDGGLFAARRRRRDLSDALSQHGGKPNTTKEKIIVLVVFVIGILAGLVNWFLMDPGFFGFQ